MVGMVRLRAVAWAEGGWGGWGAWAEGGWGQGEGEGGVALNRITSEALTSSPNPHLPPSTAPCSLDVKRQMVMAARGQTISLAFYPAAGLILYGSEQAAVKAVGRGPERSEANLVCPPLLTLPSFVGGRRRGYRRHGLDPS